MTADAGMTVQRQPALGIPDVEMVFRVPDLQYETGRCEIERSIVGLSIRVSP